MADADAYGPYGYGWTLTDGEILQVEVSKLGGASRPPKHETITVKDVVRI